MQSEVQTVETELFAVKPVDTGLKQALRAVLDGRAAAVYIASDAEDRVQAPLRELCAERCVPVCSDFTMEQLGEAAGIAVGAAACAVLTSA